jgi:hypothetical protein
MGLYDEVRWDATLPEGHPPDDRIFQTKSLDPGLEHYVVTPEGRLLLVGNGWQDEALEQAQPLQGVDVEFHGDIRIVSLKSQSSIWCASHMALSNGFVRSPATNRGILLP